MIAKQARRLVIRADRVFDGENVRPEMSVVVEDGVITGVVPSHEDDAGLAVIEAPGCTILPGLIDTHVHFMRWQGPLYLAWGVTSIRDVANQLDWILARRAEWEERPWPRVLTTGPQLEGPNPQWPLGRACADAEDAVEAVRETAAAGVDSIKLYASLPPEWLSGMVAAAHEAGLRVSIHCQRSNVLQAGSAGVDEFHHLDGVLDTFWPEHPPGWLDLWGHPDCDRTIDQQQITADRIRDYGMVATPTLAYWDSRWQAGDPAYPSPADLAMLAPEVVEWVNLPYQNRPGRSEVETWQRAAAAASRFVGFLLERGVRVLPGTDVPWVLPGISLWRELALLTESGMSPVQALRAATLESAQWLDVENIGRLAPGCVADIVVVKGDPTTRIPDRPQIEAVLRGGDVYRPCRLFAKAKDEGSDVCSDPWGREFTRAFAGPVRAQE